MPQSGSRNRQPMILATGAYLTSCIVQLRAPTSSSSLVIFTVRNEVAKVMFLHMSVILFTRYSPRSRDGYCCGRYASYWNAFLLSMLIGLLQ